jgi:hypothetical protein
MALWLLGEVQVYVNVALRTASIVQVASDRWFGLEVKLILGSLPRSRPWEAPPHLHLPTRLRVALVQSDSDPVVFRRDEGV